MLHFNELRITQDDKYLIIDASVDNQDFYDDIILDSVVIDTQATYVPHAVVIQCLKRKINHTVSLMVLIK